MLEAGTFIQNRYEIISKIGSGGMADVYKAKDHKLNRNVAVKVLKSEFRDDKVFVSKFRTEAQSAAGLAHGNIVNIYDVGEESGINYIVMEFVDGITLKEYIKDQGRLSAKETTSITLQISAGLEAAHNNGIIHRDVKPQNIMISTDGKVKVADFGIARASTVNTMTSSAMGSVHYSSPEQARGGFSDERSDIYSLGITMYEMLTGHVPFNGDTAVAVALQHLQDEVPGPKEEVPDIPYSLNQIVLKCTQKSPDRRYQNMAELIRDLRESLVNPDGDFVTIALDSSSPTMVMPKDELDQKMPSYDESMDVGAAATINEEGAETDSVSDRAYQPGSYYQKSQFQEVSPGQDEDSRWSDGSDDFDDLDNVDDPEYHPYYDSLLNPDGTSEDGEDEGGYHLEEEYASSRKRKQREEDDRELNPTLERAVTIGGIIVAVLIGCLFLALLGNAFGLFRFSNSDNSENENIVIEAETKESKETETEKKEKATEKTTEAETVQTFILDDFSNMAQSQAISRLTEMGLKYTVDTSQYSDTVPSGYVISTDPETGTEVTTGDTIKLFVSQGEEPATSYVNLWTLTGYTVERAEEALNMLGLVPAYEYEPSDTVAEGMVTRTSADDSNGEVRSGSTVTIYISTGASETSAGDGNITTYSSSGEETSSTSSRQSSGTWTCDASLTEPAGYNGQSVKITLVQNGEETTIFEGKTTFPYHLQTAGEDNVTTGTAYVYLLDSNGKETSKIEYSGITFSQAQ